MVTTDASGAPTINVTLPPTAPGEIYCTAAATGPQNTTSEFSRSDASYGLFFP